MAQIKSAPLVEGVDYYLEGEKLVFTAVYHRKRGYCCNSRCRHCPYGADGGMTERITLVGMPPMSSKRSADGSS
jgi:hypothetical protein